MDISDRVTALMERVGLARRTDQLGAVAMNAAQLLMHGGFETGEQGSPFEVVAKEPMYRLRRYFPDSDSTGRPAVVLVPPMMFVADVYDVSSTSSAVSVLYEHGIDPWVVDFGAPEHEEGGLQRTLADHIVATSEIVDRVRDLTGRDVHLGGYSQGGVFSYSVAAYRRGAGLASVISFGSPVDTESGGHILLARTGDGIRRRHGRRVTGPHGTARLGYPRRLSAARSGKECAVASAVPAATARSRSVAAQRAPAALYRV